MNKVLKLTGRRWLAEILILIEDDVNRFSQMKANMEGISDTVLSKNLTTLVIEELVTKTIYQQVPLKVEYKLSNSGKSLVKFLHELCSWGKDHVEL